jgi:hypothetical protein
MWFQGGVGVGWGGVGRGGVGWGGARWGGVGWVGGVGWGGVGALNKKVRTFIVWRESCRALNHENDDAGSKHE